MEDVPSDPESFFVRYLPEALRASPELSVGITSSGSVTCRVLGSGEWSLRLNDGVLEVASAEADDVVLQITVPAKDFEVLVIEPTRVLARGPSRPIPHGGGALAALAMSVETARLVRRVPGSVLFVAQDGEMRHRLLVTPGRRSADVDSAECTIECALADVIAMRERGSSPMQLFANGKLRLKGNIQIAMALASIFTK
jgi:hypothetical protein